MHVERLTAAAEVQPGAESEPGKESWSRELGAYTHLRQEQTLRWQGGTSKQSWHVGSRVCLLSLWQLPWCGSEPVLRHVFSRDFRQPLSWQEITRFQSKRHNMEK